MVLNDERIQLILTFAFQAKSQNHGVRDGGGGYLHCYPSAD